MLSKQLVLSKRVCPIVDVLEEKVFAVSSAVTVMVARRCVKNYIYIYIKNSKLENTTEKQ